MFVSLVKVCPVTVDPPTFCLVAIFKVESKETGTGTRNMIGFTDLVKGLPQKKGQDSEINRYHREPSNHQKFCRMVVTGLRTHNKTTDLPRKWGRVQILATQDRKESRGPRLGRALFSDG